MKILMMALLLLPLTAHAGGANLRRGELAPKLDCQTVTSGAAIQLFDTAYSTNTRSDQKAIILTALDTAYTSNYVLISTWAATTDAQGWPLVGSAPLKLEVSESVKIFVRRSTAWPFPAVPVCGLSIQ